MFVPLPSRTLFSSSKSYCLLALASCLSVALSFGQNPAPPAAPGWGAVVQRPAPAAPDGKPGSRPAPLPGIGAAEVAAGTAPTGVAGPVDAARMQELLYANGLIAGYLPVPADDQRTTLIQTTDLIGRGYASAPMFPFVMPWDDVSKTLTDLSFLNDGAAGSHGFIISKEGHFVESETGRRVRFLGVNFTLAACFPEHADAENVAARLAKFGVNLVRLNGIDNNLIGPGSIFDPVFKDHQHLDANKLERLDYLVAQLKKHGIYISIPLHVFRTFTPEDGLPASVNQIPFPYCRRVDYFDRQMNGLQEQYAHDLLTHANPYTGTCYAAEPALLSVQLTDEDSLAGDPRTTGDLLDLPQPFAGELQSLWNGWLLRKYAATPALQAAWRQDGPPLGPTLIRAGDAPESWLVDSWDGAACTLVDDGDALKAQVDQITDKVYNAQVYQPVLDLKDGASYTIHFRARTDGWREMDVQLQLDIAPWTLLNTPQTVHLTPEWQTFDYPCVVKQPVPGHGRLLMALGQQVGAVWFKDAEVRPEIELPDPVANGSLEQKAVPIPHSLGQKERADWYSFLTDTERAYADGMRTYLKNDLHAHALVSCTQVSEGGASGIYRDQGMDLSENHAIWDGPHYPNGPEEPANWYIGGAALVKPLTNLNALTRLAEQRIADKPYVLSEYNHAAPGSFQAECVPLIASFAAFQDWDAICFQDYGAYGSTADTTEIPDFFSIGSNPAKWSFMAAAAALFRMGKVPVPDAISPIWMTNKVAQFMFDPTMPELTEQDTQMAGMADKSRIAVMSSDIQLKPSGGATSPVMDWRSGAAPAAQYTINAPGAKVVVGLVAGETLGLGDAILSFGVSPNRFVALTLTAMDNKTLPTSEKALLTVVDRVENTGMRWNQAHTSVGEHWGHAPTVADGVPVKLQLRVDGPREVFVLDGTGAPKKPVEATFKEGILSFSVGPADQTLWYAIVKPDAATVKPNTVKPNNEVVKPTK